MCKIYRLLSAIVISVFLSACGGGGDEGSGSDDNGGTPPANNAPTFNLQTKLEMVELTTSEVAISANDVDGDTLTYSATSSSGAITAAMKGSTLVLTAKDVNADEIASVTVSVSDGKTSISKNIMVTVTDNVSGNHAPTLTFSQPEISVVEKATSQVAIISADADGDELTYSLQGTSPDFTASIDGTSIVIVANEVESDSTSNITVSVSDGEATVSNVLAVTITNDANGEYIAYSVSWVDADATNLSVSQSAKAKFPFSVELGSIDSLTYSITMNVSSGLNQADIASSVNSETNEVIVFPSNENSGDYTGVLTISDGFTSSTLDFSLNVYYASRAAFMDGERIIFLEEGQTETYAMTSTEGIDPEGLKIFEDDPFEVLSGDASKISFTYDNDAQTYSLTALDGSRFLGFLVRINTTDSFNGRAGGTYEVYVKGATSSQERDLEEKLILAKKFVKQSQELERLGDFLIDALEMQKVLTQQEALSERLLISDSRYFSENSSTEELTCMLEATQTGFVVNKSFKGGFVNGEYITQGGYICNVGEIETFNYSTGTASSMFYANSSNYALGLDNIELIRTIQDNDYFSAAGQTIVERVNRLAGMLKSEVSGFELGTISWEQMVDLGNGVYSRFVGNTAYGAYQGEMWVWKPEYKVLGIATSMANETVNY